MLEFEVEDNAEAMQLIRRSQQAQDDLTRLFDEVRNFAAPIALDLNPCRLLKMWREAWSLVQPECRGRDVVIDEDIHDHDLTLNVDRFRMVQVFRNLLENSLAACTDPVRIHFTCRTTAPAADARHPETDTELTAHSTVEVRISDNGPGLNPRARREVFRPFFTTKTKGTGLGMAIAHRILEAHGGSISVGNPAQGGAEFVLRFPRDHEETIPADCRRG